VNNPDAVVSSVADFVTEGHGDVVAALECGCYVEVELDEGRRARLDPADARARGLARVLMAANRQHLLVYLELDPETASIRRLRLPHVTHVTALGRGQDGGLEVRIAMSHARHLLSRDQPGFAAIEATLRMALDQGELVVLTEDDSHQIIDVRPFQPGPEVPQPPLPPELPPPTLPRVSWGRRLWRGLWSWWGFGCVSAARAQQVLDAMRAPGCDPLTAPAPCVPFLYPDDGCWARAHEMCRLMQDMKLSPRKVWIQGRLTAATHNHPDCRVPWTWHVAPTLAVRWLWLFRRTSIIDPALFTEPVSRTVWKAALGDAAATLTDSDASIYYLWGSVTDPGYIQTNQYLSFYRLQLQTRVVERGLPPYAQCPRQAGEIGAGRRRLDARTAVADATVGIHPHEQLPLS